MVTVTKERILSLLAEALLAVMAQEMRPCLRCRLYRLTPIIDERMRVLSLSTESLIRRLWNEMAVLKFGLVQAKATLARKVHLSPPLLEFYFKYRQVKRAGVRSGSFVRGVQPEQLPGIAGPESHCGIFPRVNRILLSDAAATIVGSLSGTSTVVSYIESAAGVAAGGRTGVTAMVTGLLFVAALFIAPVVGAIPAAATAPALIVVGSLVMSAVAEIEWQDPEIAVPAFLTITTIPLTFSIANGLAFGFTAFTLLKIVRGKFRQVNWFVYVLTALFVARFVYLAR